MRLIDADELLKPVGSYERVKYTYEYGDVVTVEDIDLAPTIDAEPVRHGHWTLNSMEHGVCSVCHQSSVDIVGGDWSNYCPTCGAKMDEVGE